VDGDGNGFTLNLRFAGQQYDGETGFHYNYFRTYDPATGRYITSDPIGLNGGLNTYAYVTNNPLRYIDPTGEAGQAICFVWPWGTAACAVAAIGTVISVNQCTDGVNDVNDGLRAAATYRSQQQQALNCLSNPSSCSSAAGQAHASAAQNAAQQALQHAANATRNLGTSIPGTSATGPIPTSVGDLAAGTLVNAAASQ